MTNRRNWVAVAGGFLVCLPCLLPAVMVLTRMAGLTALGGWLAGHVAVIVPAVSAALAGGSFATWFALKRTRACPTEKASQV